MKKRPVVLLPPQSTVTRLLLDEAVPGARVSVLSPFYATIVEKVDCGILFTFTSTTTSGNRNARGHVNGTILAARNLRLNHNCIES